jgi:hypothetical protein
MMGAMRALGALAVILCCSVAASPRSSAPHVDVIARPEGGIQPQAIVDADDVLHVLYFSGTAAAGDLFYVTKPSGGRPFSAPRRVNSIPGSAIATGSVRGGQLSLGRGGTVHVAWNGSGPIERAGEKLTPMWYARLTPAAKQFEPQRSIGLRTRHLDGGGSVAADGKGNVHVSWHAAGSTDGEIHRGVFVATSHDEGRTFEKEQAVVESGGVCGCCALRSLVDARGRLQILYRAAGDNIHRDAMWITPGGSSSRAVMLHPWELPACPMTTFALANAGDRVVAAWETAKQIFVTTLDPATRQFATIAPVDGSGSRRHPSVAVNAAGDRLIAWTEGTAWARGGSLAWELQDRSGARRAAQANAGPVPVWGLVAAGARRDGSFAIVR